MMKVRNAMCIFALFSIMALFFCFGVVANAEESVDNTTYTYNLSYTMLNSYSSNSYSVTWNYDNFSVPYRIVLLQQDIKHAVTPTSDETYIEYNYLYYIAFLNSDGELGQWNLSGTRYALTYTASKVMRPNMNTVIGETSSEKLSSFSANTLSTNIPIFDETTEEGKAEALNYLKTGELSDTIPDIEDKTYYDEAYYFIDFKATDFVNASWSGMSDTSKVSDDENTNINHYIAVKYVYGWQGMSVDRKFISKGFENTGNALNIDFAQYKPTVSEQYISAVLYTPYYRYGSSYYYGRTVSVALSPSGKVQRTSYSDGDYEQVSPPLDGSSIYDSEFKLIDFNTDNNGYSTWNGCTEKKYDPFNYTENTAYVSVIIGYAYKTAPGQIALRYETDIGFLISKNEGSLVISNLSPDVVLKGMKNENGVEYDTSQIFLRYISYVPCYTYGGVVYYGKSNDIFLNADRSTNVIYNDREPTNGDQVDSGNGFNISDLTNIKPSEIFGYFSNLVQTLVGSVQTVSSFINGIFGFLPSELRTCVYATFGVICACAVIRAIVGIFIH